MTIPIPTRGSCQWESSSEDDVAKGLGELDVGSGPPDPLLHSWGKR